MTTDDTPTTRPLDPAAWWRRTCWIPSTRIALSGDLPTARTARLAQLDQWVADGIDQIIDVRSERSDEASVAELHPGIEYHWLGVDDHGDEQPDEWWEAGVASALNGLKNPDSKVLVHCHMGVNRGPSMGFAILLAVGRDPIDALEAIRAARPIAAVLYAEYALDWWHHITETPSRVADQQMAAVTEWLDENTTNTQWIISRIWRADAA